MEKLIERKIMIKLEQNKLEMEDVLIKVIIIMIR